MASSSVLGKKMRCEHLSPSRADIFEQCQLRYSKRYPDSGDRLQQDSTRAMDTGTFVHKVLELYYTPGNEDDIQECIDRAKKDHDCTGFAEFKEARRMIESEVEQSPRESTNVLAVETVFDHVLESGTNIYGIIDRIDRLDETTVRIVDYKSGFLVPSYDELREGHQANMYPLWVFLSGQFGWARTVVFEMHYLRPDIVKSLVFELADLIDYMEYISYLNEQILRTENPTATVNRFCWSCAHRKDCEHYKTFILSMLSGDSSNQFKYDRDELTIENVGVLIERIKKGQSLLNKERSFLEELATCMMETEGIEEFSGEEIEVTLSTKPVRKYDPDVVKTLAEERGVIDQVMTVSSTGLKKAFKGDDLALQAIEVSTTVEMSSPSLTVKKKKRKKKDD